MDAPLRARGARLVRGHGSPYAGRRHRGAADRNAHGSCGRAPASQYHAQRVRTMTVGRPAGSAVGPRLRWLLVAVLTTVAVLSANSIYLAAITLVEWATDRPFQNYFYQYMFLAHLALGLAVVVPFLVFVILHLRAARRRRNRLALRTGYALGSVSVALLVTGLVLVRFRSEEHTSELQSHSDLVCRL